MRAILQHELGGPEVLVPTTLPDLEPAEEQVRIAVHAVGVHLVDTWIRRGEFFRLAELPTVPGREVEGVIDAVGPGVDGTWLGARVTAHLGPDGGGYADQAVVGESSLHRVPRSLSLDVAVAAIGTGRTAVAVLDLVDLGPDDVVLVTAASGGLGSLLVRAALGSGSTVVGLAGGPAKVAVVRDLGAQVVVDYRVDGWDDRVRELLDGRPVTVVLDGVGGTTAQRAHAVLHEGGSLVNYTGVDPDDLPASGGRVFSPLGPDWMEQRPGGVRGAETEALAAAVDGWRVPLVGSTFALDDAAGAHRALEARLTHGKVLLLTSRSEVAP